VTPKLLKESTSSYGIAYFSYMELQELLKKGTLLPENADYLLRVLKFM